MPLVHVRGLVDQVRALLKLAGAAAKARSSRKGALYAAEKGAAADRCSS